MSKVMSSFYVASSCSRLTGGCGGGGGALPQEGYHGHIRAEWIPRECQACHHQWLSCAPSTINSFASLGNHNGLVEYDLSYA
jgi:hypothetical protein